MERGTWPGLNSLDNTEETSTFPFWQVLPNLIRVLEVAIIDVHLYDLLRWQRDLEQAR